MNVKGKALSFITSYQEKLEALEAQKIKLYEDIKSCNSKIIQLEKMKDELLFAETKLDLKKLNKVKADIDKIKKEIQEYRDGIEVIEEAQAKLKEKFDQEAQPLFLELRADYAKQLRAVGKEVQDIINTAMVKKCDMWDISRDFSTIVAIMNKYGNKELDSGLATIEYMRDSSANCLSIIPIQDAAKVKQDVNRYMSDRKFYGRMIR